jgi:hypothetical protein
MQVTKYEYLNKKRQVDFTCCFLLFEPLDLYALGLVVPLDAVFVLLAGSADTR